VKTPRTVEIDHRHDPRDLVHQIMRMARTRRRALSDLFDDELDQRSTAETLEACGGALATVGLALVDVVNRDSDSYYLAIVPAADLRRLGARVEHFTGAKLARLRDRRRRAAAQRTAKNPWRELVVHSTRRSAEGALARHPIERIRAAAAWAPARDRPLVELTLALHDGDPVKIARTTRDPTRCLQALRYLSVKLAARLHAVAVLADRLRVKPDGKALHVLVCEACNVEAPDIKKVPATARDRLARLAEALLPRGGYLQSARAYAALNALAAVGDRASLALIEATCPDPPRRIAEVLERIRRRC
jgi:hypothetical protein